MEKTAECLKSLADAGRAFWEKDGQEEYFETELVRAEDHILDLKERSWDYEVFVIAVRPEANKIYDGRLFYDKEHAEGACKRINERGQTGNHWKVYPAIINMTKEAINNADI